MSLDRGWNFPVISVWMPLTRLHHSCMQSPTENISHIKLSLISTSDLQAVMFALQVNTSLPLWFLLIVSPRDILLLSINNHWPYNQLRFMSPASPPLYIPFTLKVPKIASRRTLKPHSPSKPVSSYWSLKSLSLSRAVLEIDSRFSVWKCRGGCKRTTHWFHLKGAVIWVQVMCLSAGRGTLEMAHNCLVTLSNESFIFSAFGSGSPHPSPQAHQWETVGKVWSLWGSLHPHLWKWES